MPLLSPALALVDPASSMPPAAELRRLASDVLRLDAGFRTDPETIALRRERIAARLVAIARAVEMGR